MKNRKILSAFIAVSIVGFLPLFVMGQPSQGTPSQRSSPVDGPYHTTPDWISSNPSYSTGAEFADINNDGWLDLVISDGNDMAMGHVNVYLNNGDGALSSTANWQSADVGYNGHLDVADVNGDGWLDVAVAYLGSGSSTGHVARVYLNNHGTLSSQANWSATLIGHAFVVDFGDMNNDGRPDLAVATGDSYSGVHYHTLVYRNIGGTLESTPSWQSSDQDIMESVHWVDADTDGWLDLAGVASYAQTRVYRNLGGVLETTASWFTSDSANQFGNLMTSGDVNADGLRDLFTADNTQQGGSGLIKQYSGLPSGFFATTHSWSHYVGYGSAVELADVNWDNKLDLATGGWWTNTWIFLNNGTGLPTSSSWTSGGTSVVEKIVFGNVGPTRDDYTVTETFDAGSRLFYLKNRNIQRIDSVKVDGVTLDFSQYMYSRDQGFVTVGVVPASSVQIKYTFSKSLDMGVSNWDLTIGNYLYYNQIHVEYIPDLKCTGSLSWSNIKPGATVEGSFTVANIGDELSFLNWKVDSYPTWGTWTFTPSSGTNLTPDAGALTVHVSMVAPDEPKSQFSGQIKIINIDNVSDYEIIPVSLATPVLEPTFHYLLLQKALSLHPFQNILQWIMQTRR